MSRLKRAIILLVVPLLTFGLYCMVYAPPPIRTGPDTAYYFLGVQHLQAGHWPWGGEPPLSFVLLWPFAAVLGDAYGLVVLSAALSAGTVLLCGLLASTTVAKDKPGRAAPAVVLVAAVTAQVLGLTYASPHYASGLLKNGLANALMCFALLIWFRRGSGKWLAVLAGALAILAHPGAVVPLGAAICLYLLANRKGLTGWFRRPRWTLGRPALWWILIVGGLAAAALAVIVVAWPTLARYAGTYFLAGDGTTSPFAGWDLGALAIRYLPLWLCLLVAGINRVRSGHAEPPHPLVGLMWAWTFALTGLGVVGGAVGRRLEIQQFIPLSVLCAAYLGSWHETERASRKASRHPVIGRAWVVSVVAVLFGIGVLASGLNSGPVPSEQDIQALVALEDGFPQRSKLVTFDTNTPYLAEYLLGVPVVGPSLLPERGLVPGPTFLLTENPTREGVAWSEQALRTLRDSGRVVGASGRLLLLRADDDAGFFARWSEDRSLSPLELLQLDPALWPVAEAPDPAGPVTQALGWLLFTPAALLMAAGLGGAPAAALGLVCSSFLWTALARSLRRRR